MINIMTSGSIDPKVWGPHGWIFLHSITQGYPRTPTKANKEIMRDFFKTLPEVLPCSTCGDSLREHMRKYPLTNKELLSRERLMNWLVNIHNEVNKQLGKRIRKRRLTRKK